MIGTAMGNRVDFTGKKIGRLNVISVSHTDSYRQKYYICRCECGTLCTIRHGQIQTGRTKSCGCLKIEKCRITGHKSKTHGLSKHKVFAAWRAMKARCYNTNNDSYKQYGLRGIEVCKRWHKFENFLADMGQPSHGHLSLDRIDNDKGYSKSNCRWATSRQQANNQSNNRYINVNGVKYTVAEAARKFDIKYVTLLARLNRGWSAKDAIKR